MVFVRVFVAIVLVFVVFIVVAVVSVGFVFGHCVIAFYS